MFVRLFNDSRGTFLPRRANFFVIVFISVLFLTVLCSNGCGVYNNLTTYFNTFYNANHLFSDAVDQVNRSPQKARDTNYFAAYVVPADAQNKFDSVIIKCSKIIQYHAESGYIPDAIFMIAQCYFYEKQAESAIKKFQELINNFPKNGNVIPAKLWFAKTEYLDKKSDAAMTILLALIPEATDAGKKDIALEATMLKAQILTDQKDLDLATEEYLKAVDIDGEGHLRAIAQFQLASIYEILEKYEKAATAYHDVLKYSPDEDLKFKAQYHYGMMMATAGKYTSALQLFDDLKSYHPVPEEASLIDVEIAKTYAMNGDTAKAFDFFRFIDTTYRNTPALDRSNYERALLFEYRYKDFNTALSYYKKVTGYGLTPEKSNFCKQKTATFMHYFSMLNNLTKCDSMLHPDLYKKAVKDTADSLGGKNIGGKFSKTTDSLGIVRDTQNVSSGSAGRVVKGDSLQLSSPVVTNNLPPGIVHDTTKNLTGMPLPITEKNSTTKSLTDTSTIKLRYPPRDTGLISSKLPGTTKKPDSLLVPLPDTSKKIVQNANPDTTKRVIDTTSGTVSSKLPGITKKGDSTLVTPPDTSKKIIPNALPDSTKLAIDTSSTKFKPPDIANSEVNDSLFRGRPGLIPRGMNPKGLEVGKLPPDSLGKFGNPMNRHENPPEEISKGREGKGNIAQKDTVRNLPKPPPPIVLTPDSIRKLIVATDFELAGIFYLELHMPDSAITLYEKIIDDTNSTRYIPGSLYALAELYRTPTDTTATDSLYDIILDKYPNTEYALKIKKMRGMQIEAAKKNPADTVFVEVASLIADKKGKEAIELLQSLVDQGDTVTVVPKALYTQGWIYENLLIQNDSAASIYKKLLNRYPKSIYALDANPRVSVKDDTTKLSEFVKIDEVQIFGRPEVARRTNNVLKKKDKTGAEENNYQQESRDMQELRKAKRDVNEDADQPDEEETPQETKPEDNNNNN
ncbi:MAG: tetratricopeptide repeat protein [Bacteroidota bacterium]